MRYIQHDPRFRILNKVSEKKQLFNAWKVQRQKEERVCIFFFFFSVEFQRLFLVIDICWFLFDALLGFYKLVFHDGT